MVQTCVVQLWCSCCFGGKLTSYLLSFDSSCRLLNQVALTSASRQPHVSLPFQSISPAVSTQVTGRHICLYPLDYLFCQYFGYVLTIYVIILVFSFLCFPSASLLFPSILAFSSPARGPILPSSSSARPALIVVLVWVLVPSTVHLPSLPLSVVQ